MRKPTRPSGLLAVAYLNSDIRARTRGPGWTINILQHKKHTYKQQAAECGHFNSPQPVTQRLLLVLSVTQILTSDRACIGL